MDDPTEKQDSEKALHYIYWTGEVILCIILLKKQDRVARQVRITELNADEPGGLSPPPL